MKRVLAGLAITAALVVCGCAPTPATTPSPSAEGGASTESSATRAATQASIAHRFATADEGRELLVSNEAYYAGFSQNDLDYRMQKTGTTMDEYKAFASEQTLDFTDEEKAIYDDCFAKMAATLQEKGYTLPPLDEIVLVKTTMAEECNVGGYTHGTTIFLSADLLDALANQDEEQVDRDSPTVFLWHEVFHCITRCNPSFRANMYKLIHFTVHDVDYPLPPSVMEFHISNPDVEHHDSSAVFSIDGKDVECFCDLVTTKHFEQPGDKFLAYATTALVPVDGTDTYYTPEQASNFFEVFGGNTDYVIDPEECMAENFAYALTYGTEKDYKSPEIIEGILASLSKS